MNSENIKVKELYDSNSFVVGLEYNGLSKEGLQEMNIRYGSEGYGNEEVAGGCSITFAKYFDGTIGAIRNMDLQLSNFCSYEMFVREGENVKYPFWSLAYLGMDEKTYRDVLKSGISRSRYNQMPYTATDSMSFGYTDTNQKSSLYCAILMRSYEKNEDGTYKWTCSGTYKEAPIRCCTQSLPALIAANCITIEQALAYVGAVDENYNRIAPSVDPTLDVYTFNIEFGVVSNHWFEVVAMEDSSGRHGVLEFIDNKAIWHEGIDYSFNYFLQKEYLYNKDGSYNEQHGAGLGRYKATVPYLKYISTKDDHLALMDGISYSHMTFYSEENHYTGFDYLGNPIDWRSEHTGTDVFKQYIKYQSKGFDTSIADSKFKLYSTYLDTNTKKLIRINSVEEYKNNIDHLQSVYDMNFVQAEENKEELMNYIRWSGAFYGSLTEEELRQTNSAWQTYFKVIADPMNNRVTRWFNENVSTADTITWEEAYKEN